MPNGKFHRKVGGVAGAGAALTAAREQEPIHMALEALGGFIGGVQGARLPDIIDPPTSPRHRDLGHAVVPVGGVMLLARESVVGWQVRMREEAARARARREASDRLLEQLVELLIEAGACILAGMPVGFAAGYASHLVLDGQTKMGLPLLGLAAL